jgi:hypothetical protein
MNSATTISPKVRHPNRDRSRRRTAERPVRRAPEVAPPLSIPARPCRCWPGPLVLEPDRCIRCGREARRG